MHSFDETAWWGDCGNTWHEEEKQHAYAKRMGLLANWSCAHPPTYDLEGRSVIDIGGGPVSLLLKCVNRGGCVVVDPGGFPAWVAARYEHCGVMFWNGKGEDIEPEGMSHFDEAWIYNTLQHVDDPPEVIARVRRAVDVIRIFEWVGIAPYPGHPHKLERETLDSWLGGTGFVAKVDEHGAVGNAYYGVFQGT